MTSSTTKEIDSITEEEPNRQFSKREVSSNWNKYTESSAINDVEVPVADFEQLLSVPSSIGAHFLLNSEKSWEGNDDWYNRDEYFRLNLVELTQSLATIPFYERQQYSKNVFNSEEIEDMDRQARFQRIKWMANTSNTGKIVQDPIKEKCEIKETETASVINVPQNDEDDLDELLSGTRQFKPQKSKHSSITLGNAATTPNQVPRSTLDTTDDIQKWLDDVLILDS